MADLVQVEKLHDGRLWVITLTEGSRAGVNAWEQAVRTYIAASDNRPERYLVYDTSPIPNLAFTSYLQERATVLAKDNRDASGRVALVLRLHPTVLYFFDVFVRLTGNRIQPKLDVKFFSQREDAIQWVEEVLPKAAEA